MYTLLIADDEPMECDAIELLVKQAKFPLRIIKARNGLEAVQFFRQHGPDIIFLDIRMPGMDGLEAARLIRSEKADIPIVFLTAWSTFEFAQQAVRLQANEYLVKPVSRKDIFDLLDRILEQLEAKKAISEEREKEVRQTLNLFSTEFFTALKYNNLKEEAVSKYFTMQGIRGTQGIALVINGITEREINAVFASLNVRVSYYPSKGDGPLQLILSLGAWETRLFEDALSSILGLPEDSAGALRLTVLGNSPGIVASSRTYAEEGSKSYGLAIGVLENAEAVAGERSALTFLSSAASTRPRSSTT